MWSERRLFVLFGALLAVGLGAWAWQLGAGLGLTGLHRDVSWGLYISQFTFFVGVAASAVMVGIPLHLHGFRPFVRLAVLAEVLAVAAVVAAGLFVLVDLGRPERLMNLLLHPAPRSPMLWDMLCLGGYLLLNLTLGAATLWAERLHRPAPAFVRPLVWLSVPWAFSIHTVTAFLYAGLPGRPLWETAVLAPRFLASAFASGPALLLLLCLALARDRAFAYCREVTTPLARIVAWALAADLFLVGVELFTGLYGHRPEHLEALRAFWLGGLAPWVQGGLLLTIAAFALLLRPGTMTRDGSLALAAALAFGGVWMEKGMGVVVGGFLPGPLGEIPSYLPTLPEVAISLGVWAAGALVLLAGIRAVRWARQR
jgi:molybdopterin-containing oxidoreductase family membrane subunit